MKDRKILEVDSTIYNHGFDDFVNITKITYDDGFTTVRKDYENRFKYKDSTEMVSHEPMFLDMLKDTKIVPKIYKTNSNENGFFIETEFIKNSKTLIEYLYITEENEYGKKTYKFNDKISYKRRFEYAIKIAKAFEKIHDKGIVHRDIKPNNILIKNCKVYVIDFGISLFKGQCPKCLSGNKRYSPEDNMTCYRACRFQDDLYSLAKMFTNDFELNKYCDFNKFMDYKRNRLTIKALIKELEKGYAKCVA